MAEQKAPANEQPIFIKKVKKGGHAAHHGGAWKVAYADFVTAMMAFFMLLWLLNVTTEEQKAGIADYFAPSSASPSLSGAGGMLSGRSLDDWGARVSEQSRESLQLELAPPEASKKDEAKPEDEDEVQSAATSVVEADEPVEAVFENPDEAFLEERLAELEQRRFEEAEAALKQAIQDIPELAELARHLIVDVTPDGLRIQIVDQAGESMFPSGSYKMYQRTRVLMAQIARVVESLPNRIAITGHTDATPYRTKTGYGNWELSTDRANASRRELVGAGVPLDRIAYVAGKADQEPLFTDDPFLPNNRRISMVLLRDAPVLPSNLR